MRGHLGFRLTTFVAREKDGTERVVEVPEQPLQREVGWFQAYVKNCRGWLNPQTVLPSIVAGKGIPAVAAGR